MNRPHRPRLLVVLLASIGIAATVTGIALAVPECSTTDIGIDCEATGTTTSTITTTEPPLRYLSTTVDPVIGECWYWSRYPPGLDTWDPYYDAAVLTTKWLLPECPESPGSTTISVTSSAWAVFRSFPLAAPQPLLRPEVGITNMLTLLAVSRPPALSHSEVLPDGTLLEVRAEIETVRVDWGDGTPPAAYPASIAFTAGASHAYTIKTCSEEYRLGHPSGWRCHPTLDAYPVTVTFSWIGRYRAGGSWIRLGTIDRPSTRRYDVDEVVGVLVTP